MQGASRSGWAYVPAGRLVAPSDPDELGCQDLADISLDGSSVISTECMMTASLRATATAARLKLAQLQAPLAQIGVSPRTRMEDFQ